MAASQGQSGLALLLDQHLDLLADPDGHRLAADLADLRAVEQALGALIEQGWPPAQARQELLDRADTAGRTPAAVARPLLAALLRPPAPDYAGPSSPTAQR